MGVYGKPADLKLEQGRLHIWQQVCDCPLSAAQGFGGGNPNGEAGLWLGQQRHGEAAEIRLGTRGRDSFHWERARTCGIGATAVYTDGTAKVDKRITEWSWDKGSADTDIFVYDCWVSFTLFHLDNIVSCPGATARDSLCRHGGATYLLGEILCTNHMKMMDWPTHSPNLEQIWGDEVHKKPPGPTSSDVRYAQNKYLHITRTL